MQGLSSWRMPLQRWLAVVMVGVGAIVLAYGVVAYLTTDDPLRGLLLALVAAPSVAPIVFGVWLFRGRRWAASVLRAYLIALLAVGVWLHVVVGLSVFAPASFGVLLVGACLAWVALSFAADRRPVGGPGAGGGGRTA